MKLIQTKNFTTIAIIQIAVFSILSMPIYAMNGHSLALKRPTIMPLPNNFPHTFNMKINLNNEKYQQSVTSMLADILYEELHCPCTIYTSTVIQPLRQNIFHIPTIKARKIISLDKYDDNNSDQLTNTIINYIPLFAPQTNSPKNDKKKHNAKQAIINVLYEHSFKKNISTQILLSNRLLDRCNISLEKQKHANGQLISCALEYLTFLLTLQAKNIPIVTQKDLANKLLKIRNQSCSSLQYILQICRYIQAQTENDKKRSFDLLETYCNEEMDQEIKQICLFLINYGNPTLSPNNGIKQFIDTLKKQDNPSLFLRRIAQEPLTDLIISKLHSAAFSNDDKELSDLHIIMAEIYYYDKNFIKAHEFFSKNNINTIINSKINLKAYKHAFKAYLLASENFSYDDINSLILLTNNDIYSHLLKIKQKNKNLSYKIGLFIHTLIKKSCTEITPTQQITLINNALHHLKCSGCKGSLIAELNMAGAIIYKNNNDIHNSFKYIIRAMKHNVSINTQNDTIVNIIQNTQKNQCSFYEAHSPLIFHALQYINNLLTKDELTNTFTLSMLRSHAIGNFFSNLLPYYEQAYKTNKNNRSETISYLLAFHYFKKNNYSIARYFIDQLQPIPKNMLLFKVKIYTAHNQPLSPEELPIIIDEVMLNKELIKSNDFFSENETIFAHAALLAKNFFISSPQHYEYAQKLISHYGKLTTAIPTDIVTLVLFINDYLTAHNDPYLDIWNKTLNESQFYNKLMDASHYDASTNYKIAQLLLSQRATHQQYEKTISHFIAAINDPKLLPVNQSTIKTYCGELYYEWALSMKNNENEYLRLLDIAITHYNNEFARNEKAEYILFSKDDFTLTQEAQELLLKNIQEYGTQKGIAPILMAHCYLHGIFAEIPLHEAIKKVFPFDIDKAIEYLLASQEPVATEMLAILYSGITPELDSSIKEKYTNYEKAMHYTNLLLSLNYKLPYILTIRNYIYCKSNQPHYALAEINKYLFTENSSINNDGIDAVLRNTLDFILDFTIKNDNYTHALTCFEMRYDLYKKKDLHLRFNAITKTQQHTAEILNKKITTDSAIQWCCHAALDECFHHDGTNPKIIYDKKALSNYINTTAAQGKNINAQLTLLPYLTKHSNPIIIMDQTLLYDALYYAHKGLTHHNFKKKPREINPLIKELQALIEGGYALACYIYLNYCKHNVKDFEDTLLTFSKVQIPTFHVNDKYSLLEEITNSCSNIFNKYAQAYMQNNTKSPLNTIATIIFASMLMCSKNTEKLKLAIEYFEDISKTLTKNLHLPYYKNIVQILLSEAYYNYELKEKAITGVHNINLLKKSACHNHLNACQLLGNLYITELILFKEKPFAINEKDFLPYIKKHVQTETNPIVEHIELLSTYHKAMDLIELYEITSKQITHNAYTKKIIQTKYSEDSKKLAQKALESYELNKHQGLNTLTTIIDSEKSPLLSIKLAYIFLLGTNFYKQNYETSRNHLITALNRGLISVKNNQQKKFHDGYFLNTLFLYINSLIKNDHPKETTQPLLSIIKKAINAANINLDDFYTLFKKSDNNDLSTHPLWKNSL